MERVLEWRRAKNRKGAGLTADTGILWVTCTALLGLALGAGLTWMTAGRASTQETEAGRMLAAALLGLIVAGTVGFPLLYGAVHFPALGESARASWQWEPFGEGSGLLAWSGIGLRDADSSSRAALLLLEGSGTVCVLAIALGPVLRRLNAPGWIAATVAIAGLVYPLMGHWVWGSGWLAATGRTGFLGHGTVDAGGAGVHYGLGGMLALAALLATRGKRRNPVREGNPSPGAVLLTFVGMLALQLGSLRDVSPRLAAVAGNTLAAAVAGGFIAGLYMAFTTSRLRGDMIGRGILAGTAAAAGPAPFAPLASLVLVGAVAGLLVCLGSYLVERVWKLEDSAGVVATFGLGGLWGMLATGLLADGSFGIGLNGVGSPRYLGVSGQGVTGIFLLAPGMAPDFGQFAAQILGAVVLLAWGLGFGYFLFRLVALGNTKKWQ